MEYNNNPWGLPYGRKVSLHPIEGSTITAVFKDGKYDSVRIVTDRGELIFEHDQDCCEQVALEDGWDELSAMVGERITSVEAPSTDDAPVVDAESYSWTFYKIETNKSSATLRFLGCSNGYYAEGVDAMWLALED